MDKNKYTHLSGELPRVISIGLELLGTIESPGSKNNPTIMKWAKECYIDDSYDADSIPWCGLFVAVVVKRSGRDFVKAPLWARSWAKWGEESEEASLGDVLVFSRNGGGHVGFYIAEDDDCYHVLGGNQSDAVTIARIKKSRCIAVRKPRYNNRPKSAIPYMVGATGDVSINEA
jgi:uncharacterized protein (TIGR02594 family)